MGMDQPLVFVIFGATGDLTHRKLMPALYRLLALGLLGSGLTVIGVGRRDLTDDAFRDDMRSAVAEKVGTSFDTALWHRFAERIRYVQGDFGDQGLYAKLTDRLAAFDTDAGACCPRFFYLATPPEHYETILTNLHSSKLSEGCGQGTVAYTRVLIEKPFGKDLATAQKLDLLLSRIFEERQIFRIDHYLGLETVQNILAFRFANGIFEPMWNHNAIDHVEITLSESIGVAGRGAFYDGVGALRDVAQNHMFEMLSLIAMEPPTALDAKSIHDAKAALMRAGPLP